MNLFDTKFKRTATYITIGIAIWCIVRAFVFGPFHRNGEWALGISGWELTLIILVYFGLITYRYLSEKVDDEIKIPSSKLIKRVSKFSLFGAFVMFMGMQIVEIGIRNKTSWIEELVGVESETATREIVCTIGVFVAVIGVLFGIIAPIVISVEESVKHHKSIGVIFPTTFYIIGSTYLGFTAWNYLAWFILTNGDPHLWSSIDDGKVYGFFSISRWGVFFDSPEELLFMISSGLVIQFIAVGTALGKNEVARWRRKIPPQSLNSMTASHI